MAIFLVDGVEERPYFGDYSGFVYRADVSGELNDHPLNVETAINAYWWSNWKDFDELTDQKGVPQVYIYHKDTVGTLSSSLSRLISLSWHFDNRFSLPPS